MDMRQMIRIVESAGKEPPMKIIAFHGTRREFDRFDTAMIGSMNDGGFLGRGFYFSTTFDTARSYAWEGGRVLKCRLTLHNPYRLHSDNPVQYRSHVWPGGGSRPQAIRDGLVKHGYDGVICAHWPEHPDDRHSTEIVVFDPDQIEVLEVIDPERRDDHGGSGDEMEDHMARHRRGQADRAAKLMTRLSDLARPTP